MILFIYLFIYLGGGGGVARVANMSTALWFETHQEMENWS